MLNVIRGIEGVVIDIIKKSGSIKLPKGFPVEVLND
jgi:hypothetical protein